VRRVTMKHLKQKYNKICEDFKVAIKSGFETKRNDSVVIIKEIYDTIKTYMNAKSEDEKIKAMGFFYSKRIEHADMLDFGMKTVSSLFETMFKNEIENLKEEIMKEEIDTDRLIVEFETTVYTVENTMQSECDIIMEVHERNLVPEDVNDCEAFEKEAKEFIEVTEKLNECSTNCMHRVSSIVDWTSEIVNEQFDAIINKEDEFEV